MIYPVRQFSGKSNDTLEYVVEAVLQKSAIRIHHADALTLRPFFRKYEKNSRTQPLQPVVSLSEGMDNLSRCLGLEKNYIEEYSDTELLMKKINSHDFDKDPIVLGPLSKKVMWNRVDSLFYDNQSYFITLVGIAEDGFYVHDPEGTPYLRLDTEDLKKNVMVVPAAKLLVHLGEIKENQRNESEIWSIFLEELKKKCQCVINDEYVSAAGFKLLYEDIGNRIRSSEKMRLYYNFIDLQNANQSIKECFAWNQITAVCESSKNQISEKIDSYNKLIGDLLVDIIHEDIQKIKKNLLLCAEFEKEMLTMYSML